MTINIAALSRVPGVTVEWLATGTINGDALPGEPMFPSYVEAAAWLVGEFSSFSDVIVGSLTVPPWADAAVYGEFGLQCGNGDVLPVTWGLTPIVMLPE